MDTIKIKLEHYNDIIRQHITEDGHINLFGTTFSVKRYDSKKGKLIYELKATKENEHDSYIKDYIPMKLTVIASDETGSQAATYNCHSCGTNKLEVEYKSVTDVHLINKSEDTFLHICNTSTRINIKNIEAVENNYIIVGYEVDAAERDAKGNIIITNGAEYKGVVPSVIDITEVDGCCLIIHNRRIKIDDKNYDLIDSFDNSDGKHVYRFMADKI